MKWICMLLGVFCLLYYIVLINYAGSSTNFINIWLLGAAVFLGVGGLLWLTQYKGLMFMSYIPNWCKAVTIIAGAAAMVCFVVVEGFIIRGMASHGEPDLDYLIVLGAKVNGEVPSKSLYLRMKKAEEYLIENPDTKAVMSGGKGPGEDISEAEAMRRYFEARGIEAERLIMEDSSTDTSENLKYSFRLLDSPDAKVGIVTNDFHVARGVAIGKRTGYQNLCGIAARSDTILQLNYMVREFFGVMKDTLMGNM